jgi:flagellum-specific peptidoglycan hydrolase FlgJ
MVKKYKKYSDEQIIQSFRENRSYAAILEALSDYKSLIRAYQRGLLNPTDIQRFCVYSTDPIYAKLFGINDFSIFNDMDDDAIDLYMILN